MSERPSIQDILAESERVAARYSREGTFADYLKLVVGNPEMSRLSHKLVYDSMADAGIEESPTGAPVYKLFDGEVYGLEDQLERIVQYFASGANRLEIRKRILLMIGPPASGKSTIAALLKRALERYTRTDAGAAYAIKGCPMQEEPLHLIPHDVRPRLMEEFGIYVEGDLCPRCRYVLRSEHQGRVGEMPVSRVVFSEMEAVGIGFYVANNPNPSDASLLVGSIDTSQLDGDRVEVAGKAFRMDGELNVANRGIVEFGEIFKADRNLLTTLLGLAQEQLIKMERFGSVYVDEVVIAHSNEGDFEAFMKDESSEALKDRIIAVQIPYNVRVQDEIKIYQKLLASSISQQAHMAPLTLAVTSTFAVLSRLEPPDRQGMTVLNKLRVYDGRVLQHVSSDDVKDMRRHHPDEGMQGISPRYVMNRLSGVASDSSVACLSPLRALDALWQGLKENVTLDREGRTKYLEFIRAAVEEYGDLAVRDIQRAYKEGFEETAKDLLDDYLTNVEEFCSGREYLEHDMRDIEKQAGVADRDRSDFRHEMHRYFENLKSRGVEYDYTSEYRLMAAIESRLFTDRRTIDRTLSRPRSRQRIEWRRLRSAVYSRLIENFGYCEACADDLISFAVHWVKSGSVLKTPKNEGIEWQWKLNPVVPSSQEE
jgi:serine protein kinase